MGVVYRAVNVAEPSRTVALKVIRGGAFVGEEQVRELVPEAFAVEPVPGLIVILHEYDQAMTRQSPRRASMPPPLVARVAAIEDETFPAGFGELAQESHTALDNVARLVGRSWLGITTGDGLRALDYLQARPDVDAVLVVSNQPSIEPCQLPV